MRVRAKNKVVGATAGVLGAQPAGREGTKVRDGDRQRTGRVRVSIERNGTPRGSAAAPTPTHDTGVAPAGPPRRPRSHPPKRTGKGDHIVEPDLVAPAQLCDRHVAALAEVDGLGEVHDGEVNLPRHRPPLRGSGVNHDTRHLIPSAAHTPRTTPITVKRGNAARSVIRYPSGCGETAGERVPPRRGAQSRRRPMKRPCPRNG